MNYEVALLKAKEHTTLHEANIKAFYSVVTPSSGGWERGVVTAQLHRLIVWTLFIYYRRALELLITCEGRFMVNFLLVQVHPL